MEAHPSGTSRPLNSLAPGCCREESSTTMRHECIPRHWAPLKVAFALLLATGITGCSEERQPAEPDSAPTEFPIPPTIVVDVSPFRSVDDALASYERIDWRRDRNSADAATLAYAAHELQHHLALSGVDVSVEASVRANEPAIVLAITAEQSSDAVRDQQFSITPRGRRIDITAPNRVGVLYGTYRLLEHLGFAWHDQHDGIVPRIEREKPVRWPALHEYPAVKHRGFWIYGPQDVPDDYAVWMARNRLNVGGRVRSPLAAMLGMSRWDGEHDIVQQEFSREGLFEAHPSWYALIDGERRRIPPTGPYFNPAYGNPDAARYFAERLVERLAAGDLQSVDIVNVWHADDRGNAFDQSAEALALGNETDNLLHFYSVTCRAISEARLSGRLDRPVTLAGMSYFRTMQPPTNPTFTDQLEGCDYLHLFYLIERDWSGSLVADLDARDTTREMLDNLRAWAAFTTVTSGVVEYHNVSTSGGVGVTDLAYLAENYRAVMSGKSGLYAYMHPLLTNPGPRRLTNVLQGKLAWNDVNTRQPSVSPATVISCYFADRYGTHAAAWQAVTELMSGSVENASQIFGINSLFVVLFQEQIWSEPPYSRTDANSFIAQYRAGGRQQLPGGYSGRVAIAESFRGLDESIAIQDRARARWESVLAEPMPAEVRARMQSDVAWFLSTSSRYRLMAATCDYILAAPHSTQQEHARSRMEAELTFLSASPVLDDTISPVNQRAFLSYHRALLAGAQ
jgi:hypothetical protein